MRITISIAACNVGAYIEKTVLSALNQDYQDLDVLVIDDNSKDNTFDVVENLSQSHPRGKCIRIIRNDPNQGTANVRNQCIDGALGEYIYFLDGDDYLTPNAISLLYNKAKETQAEMVIAAHSRFVETDDGDKVVDTIRFKPGFIRGEYALVKWLNENHSDYYPVALWNKLFKVDFLRKKQVRCVPAHFIWEDIYFAFLTSLRLETVATIADVTMLWRIREGSATQSLVKKERMDAYLNIYDQIISEIAIEKASRSDHIIPIGLYYVITQRYLAGFITKDIMSSTLISSKDKREYLKHISSLTKLEIQLNDLYGKEEKMVFKALKSGLRYELVKLIFWSFPRIKRIMR